ncbi:hypothetical protein BTR40_24375 [Vibrio parahaemolyticus]|uniref:hypothetical protein n=1 Tax=Vibrio parahaemolyticus TaxID=670 RepID=UPI000A380D80|nr:hypothetical protein [Vibrio parahaemolyticus]OUJ33665.1 hypothetical protein BTR40_24375 [Vibrio parahaemolyticus]
MNFVYELLYVLSLSKRTQLALIFGAVFHFVFGEKSAHFRNELKIQQMRKYLNDIDDISSATCNKIFDLINGLRKSHDDDIIDFQSNHQVFFSFFLDKENKPIFFEYDSGVGTKS